jgi:hypothetical protein
MASTALPPTYSGLDQIRVGFIVGMASWTMGCENALDAPCHVLSGRDCFQVKRVDAERCPAKVIDLLAGRNQSKGPLEKYSVD